MTKLFFSYSHADEDLRDVLEKHLSSLRRQGLIESWHDRRITAGAEFDTEINSNLDEADIVLLLVSANFLHSDYCYSREMARAMERHEQGSAKVIPVILSPCDWRYAPLDKLLAVPKDGKAITTWANQDEAFVDVAQYVRKAVEALASRNAASPQLPEVPGRTSPGKVTAKAPDGNDSVSPASQGPRTSNLRLKKEFTQLDKDRFVEDSFEYMVRFFEGSLSELTARNPGIEGRFTKIDAHRFSSVIYRHGAKIGECSIGLGGLGGRDSGICFSHDASSRGNSYNEMLNVEADSQSLYFKPWGMHFRGSEVSQLSQQGAAEYFWDILIRPLQE